MQRPRGMHLLENMKSVNFLRPLEGETQHIALTTNSKFVIFSFFHPWADLEACFFYLFTFLMYFFFFFYPNDLLFSEDLGYQ